jgi:tetratricopeptide (TPR) repeat protein
MRPMVYRGIVIVLALAGVLLGADSVVASARKKLADKKYDEAITQLEAAYKTKPTADVKKTLAEAYMAKGDSFMTNDTVPPRVKYTTALRSYREVLKYDKDNKTARQNISTIESIYKSMGRPIPQ